MAKMQRRKQGFIGLFNHRARSNNLGRDNPSNWWETALDWTAPGATSTAYYLAGDKFEANQMAGARKYIANHLNDGYAKDYWNSLSEAEQDAIINNSTYTDYAEDGFLDNFFGGSDVTDIDSIIAHLNEFGNIGDVPVAPDLYDVYDEVMSGDDPIVNDLLASLTADTARQTDLYESQLAENNVMFDDLRSNTMARQHQQNAQLMDTYQSAMSKTRRNALEAGASAGLRLAENINTTLAIQNKQAQTSLETSNQLAQQLLNQRQAAAGIRSDYSNMLSKASDKRNDIYQQGTQTRYDYYNNKYNSDYDAWDSQFDSTKSPFANSMKEYVRKQSTQNSNKYSQSTN